MNYVDFTIVGRVYRRYSRRPIFRKFVLCVVEGDVRFARGCKPGYRIFVIVPYRVHYMRSTDEADTSHYASCGIGVAR